MSQILINDPNRAGGSSALDCSADGWTLGPANAQRLARWAQDINAMFQELYRQFNDNDVIPVSTPFSTSVLLTTSLLMPDTAVTSQLAFTPNASGAVSTGYNRLRLVADGNGAHVPTFVGFTAQSTSQGWLNTAGAVNLVKFWYDGTTFWYGVWQGSASLAPQGMPVSAPAVTGIGVVHGSNPTVTLNIGGSGLNPAIVPPGSAFSLSSPQNATIDPNEVSVTADSITLGLIGTINSGDTVTLSFTPPVPTAYAVAPKTGAAQDTSGNWLAAFASAPVTVS